MAANDWFLGVSAPRDANGSPVPLDTKELVYKGETREVLGLVYSTRLGCWFVEFWNDVDRCVSSCTIPDSWERLERDAAKTSCAYFGRSGLCVDCPALEISQMCNVAKAQDIVRRAEALAGVSGND